MPSKTQPSSFTFPDLISYCPFPADYHIHGDVIAERSVRWLEEGCPELTKGTRQKLAGLKAGQLAAWCYPYCDDERFRVISDYLNLLFHLDDISDGMMKNETEVLADAVMNALWFPHSYMPTSSGTRLQPEEEISAGRVTREFWARCIQNSGPGFQARFCENMHRFFHAVSIEAHSRDNRIVPDLKKYNEIRRDLSGGKPVFDLIEYGLGIDLPDFVVNDPIIVALNQGANDSLIWSNDIYSYNKEQAQGDTLNALTILMKHNRLDLQDAVDHTASLFYQNIDEFCENKKRIPTWGPEIDRDVAAYVRGLEHWIIGNVTWSFVSERYFGKQGAAVKKTRVVQLIPQRVRSNAA